ncbi:MAG: hypothetical protein M1839_002760 [Geoglossum umbratile]|nr:MAG: hypothetical protein M1839_002760 [Geoglossum umbratile]
MPDPTAIVGLISACVSLADKTYRYTSSFKDGPRCVADLNAEINAVYIVLQMLRDHLQRTNHEGRAFDRTSVLFFAGDGCRKRLESLENRLLPSVSENKLIRFLRRSKWPLDEADTIKEVEALQRYMQLFNFALTIEGFAMLSSTQADALAQLQAKLDAGIISSGAPLTGVQSSLHEILDTVRVLPQMMSAVESISNQIGKLNIEAERARLLNSLPSLPFDEKHRDLQLRRTSGLGQWLLNMPEFKALCEGSTQNDTLWCYGAPGAGKTFLTSIVIDYLDSRAAPNNFRVVYFYFDYRQQSEQTPFKFVACLLKQILLLYQGIPAATAGLCRRLKEGKGLPGWEELTQVLAMLCSESGNLFFVFDALDESDENTNRGPILGVLDSLIPSTAKLFVTSRSYCLDIKSTFRGCPQIQAEATDADVRSFVDRRISESRRMSAIIKGALREEVIRTIVENSQGMFLLPALQVGNILSQTNENEVRRALRGLPSGLVQNLDLAIERIKNQDSQSQTRASLAMQTLTWLSHVQRTLTISELQHALATMPGVDRFDPKNLTDSTFLVESCLGLVTVDQKTSVVRLVHLTINEYLQERRDELLPQGHKNLAINCLNYLMLQDFGLAAPPRRGDDLEKLTTKYPFLKYASTYWGQHASKQFDLDMEKHTRLYLTRENSVLLSTQLAEMEAEWKTLDWSHRNDVFEFIVRNVSLLHIAARFGIEKLVEEALESSADPNPRDSWGRTPLMLAAAHGHNTLLRKLLSSQAIEINAISSSEITALGAAVKYNQLETVQILLSSPIIDINLGGPFFQIQGFWHTRDAEPNIAKLFLSRADLDVNAIGKSQDKPIWQILMNDFNFELLQLLLSRGDLDPSKIPPGTQSLSDRLEDAFNYSINSDLEMAEELVNTYLIWNAIEADPRFPTPEDAALRVTWPVLYYTLSWEEGGPEYREIAGFTIWHCSTEHRDNVSAGLRSHGLGSLTFKDSRGRGFLHFVATLKDDEYVRWLLIHGADSSSGDASGWTPLHAASKAGIESNTQLLLASKANASAVDSKKQTPLHCALESEHESVALLLLAAGADASIVDSDGRSALHWAARKGYEEIVSRVLKEGVVDIAALDTEGRTVLHCVAESKSEASGTPLEGIARQLLASGAGASVVDNKNRTPLYCALQFGHEALALLLLDAGADGSTANSDGWSTLHWAANKGYEKVVRRLLSEGVDVNAADTEGWTVLHSAADSKSEASIRIVQLLVDRGVDIDAADYEGWTPLQGAAGTGTLETLEYIAERTRNIDSESTDCTALQRIAMDMNIEKARVLIQHGADPTRLDCYGRSSWDWLSAHPPFHDRLQSFTTAYSASAGTQKRHLLAGLSSRIALLLQKRDASASDLYLYAFRAGRALLLLGDDGAARLLFGVYFGHVRNRPGGTMYNEACDNCGENDVGHRFVCRVCAVTAYCANCRTGRKNDKFPWCRGHEYLEVDNKAWMGFPEGVVNERGQRLEEFLRELQQRYFPGAPPL